MAYTHYHMTLLCIHEDDYYIHFPSNLWNFPWRTVYIIPSETNTERHQETVYNPRMPSSKQQCGDLTFCLTDPRAPGGERARGTGCSQARFYALRQLLPPSPSFVKGSPCGQGLSGGRVHIKTDTLNKSFAVSKALTMILLNWNGCLEKVEQAVTSQL